LCAVFFQLERKENDMTQNNRETLQRAVGIVEGIAWAADEQRANALFAVAEMISTILDNEPTEHFRAK
jgi:hypothetical protein